MPGILDESENSLLSSETLPQTTVAGGLYPTELPPHPRMGDWELLQLMRPRDTPN